MLTPDEIEQERQQLLLLQQQQDSQNMQLAQQSINMDNERTNLVKEQLSLDEELDLIEKLLRGYMMKENEYGERILLPPDHPDKIIFEEYGIYLIMRTIKFYLNKDTLLSNYEETVILNKMEDFSTSLNDAIFMEYEKVFKEPTEEELQKKYLEKIDKKMVRRRFAYEMVGSKINEEELKKEFAQSREDVEREIGKIKQQVMKNRLKEYDLIQRCIQDIVHSTYLRAWNGQERRTLRQHIHITESANSSQFMPQQNKKGGSSLNPTSWFRR